MTQSRRRLKTRVQVGGQWYGPDSTDIPDHVAEQIRNPKAWADESDEETAASVRGIDPGTASGHRLARTVYIGNKAYGPDDKIPDDVAAQITNPKAWVDGKVPGSETAAEGGSDGDADGKGGSNGSGPASGEDPSGAGDGAGSGAGDGQGDGDGAHEQVVIRDGEVKAPRKATGRRSG